VLVKNKFLIVRYQYNWYSTAKSNPHLQWTLTKIHILRIVLHQTLKIMQHTFSTSQRSALNTVLDQLIALLEPEAVYCLGMQQATNKGYNACCPAAAKQQHIHFYLLVITKNNDSNATADVADIIKTKSEGSIKTTLLIHAPNAVLYPKGSQKHFFEWMTANAKLVYGSGQYQRPDAVAKQLPGLGCSKGYWDYRYKTALALLEPEKAVTEEAVPQVNATLLHLATEHLCLGLIGIFSGYRPNHFGLGYLLDLCDIFCPKATEVFSRNSEDDRRLFKILSLHLSQMRNHDHNNITTVDLAIIKARVLHFMDNAVALVTAEVLRVETLRNAVEATVITDEPKN
jgi:hypothetical protein